MPRIEVNFMEVLLREFLIDRTIYINDDGVEVPFIVKELDYFPDLNSINVCNMSDPTHVDAVTYKMSIKDNFDIDYEDEIKKVKTQKKVKGIKNKK